MAARRGPRLLNVIANFFMHLNPKALQDPTPTLSPKLALKP